MNDQEALAHRERLAKFDALNKRQSEVYAALRAIQESGRDEVHNQTPFTGNTRESRKVEWMRIGFTQTRGGAAPVEMFYETPGISASALGRFLEEQLETELKELRREIEEL